MSFALLIGLAFASTTGVWCLHQPPVRGGARLFLRVGRDVAHGAAALGFCFLHLGLAFGHALDETLLVADGAGFEFGFWHFVHEPCLADGKDVLGGPVERECGGEVITEEEEHERHEHDDLLLHGVAGLGRHANLQEAGNRHDDGQDIEREATEEGEVHERVRLGQVIDPEKPLAAEFDGILKHPIEAEEDRNLDEHRQTTAERVDAVFLIETHRLGVDLVRVVGVFLFDFGHLWLELGHPLHGVSGLGVKRPDDDADGDG